MNLEQRIGQMLMAGFHGLTAPDYFLDWLREGRIGGVILFARNVADPQQLADLTASLHAAAASPILIGIDQEGGTVARMRQGFTESPGALALSSAQDAEALTEQMSGVLGAELRALGINWDYAPAVDITYNAGNPTVGTRSYGSDPARVSRLAAAAVRGFQGAGIAACAKHFPGLGNTAVDTHLALASISQPLDHLLNNDLKPYEAVMAADVASIMTTHTLFTALDAEHPATLSKPIVTGLLRERLGFEGVVTTDCMEMKAIADHYGAGESAVLAALAGVDIILFSHTRTMQETAYDALLDAARSGRLPESIIDAAVTRITKMKAQYAITDAPQPARIRAEAHVAIAETAARAGVTVLRQDDALFPLRLDLGQIGLIEFASYMDSEVMERGGLTGFASTVQSRAPHIETVSLKSIDPDPDAMERARVLAAEANVLVLATRNAHLIPTQLQMAQEFMASAQRVVLLCLRNPFDAQALPGAQVVICTHGDATPSLEAAVDALQGVFTPTGQLRVPVEINA